MRLFLLTIATLASLSWALRKQTCIDCANYSGNETAAVEVATNYLYYNAELHANNVIDVALDKTILTQIRAGYDEDIHPYYDTNKSTEKFCLVAPYSQDTLTFKFVNEIRSDIRWYSVNNEETYEKYSTLVTQLGLLETVKERKWVDEDDEPSIYTMFFIPRSFSKSHEMHEDWPEEVGTQVTTFLIPLSDNFNIGLAYLDNDNRKHELEYKFGNGFGIAGGFKHSTGIGESESQDVLLCVYIGSTRKKEIWKYALRSIADELEHYMSPINGFARNENFQIEGVTSKCQ